MPALAVVVGALACGEPQQPSWPPVTAEQRVLDIVDAFADGAEVRTLRQHPEQGLAAYPAAVLDKTESLGSLASDLSQRVIHARAESAFAVTTPTLGPGARLVARTFVYPVDRRDPARADPAPVVFRVRVDGTPAAEISSDYVRDMSREHPFDQLMRVLEVDLSAYEGRAVELTFETTRDGQPQLPAGAEASEPAWWSLVLSQRVDVPRLAASPSQPNLLVVCVDTLAARRLSSYGHVRDTSPNLTALAARGTRFAAAHSASSWTLPSTASLLTGQAPNTHGVLGDARSFLMDALLTWPERLTNVGFEGAAFVSNALIAQANNFQQGFGTWVQDNGPSEDGDADAAGMVDHFVTWLDGQPRGARWFAYLHLMDPHAPYGAPGAWRDRFSDPAFVEQRDFGGHLPRRLQTTDERLSPAEQAHVADLYDGEVAYTDAELGRLLELLAARGLLDRSVVVVTADHGEELFEYGRLGHGYALSEPMLAVPLVLAGPGIPVGEVVDEPVSTASLANTLVSLALGRGAVARGLAHPLLPLSDVRRRREATFAMVRTQLFSDAREVLVSGLDADGRKVVLQLAGDGALGADGAPPALEATSCHRLGAALPEATALDLTQLPVSERLAFEALAAATLDWYVSTAAERPQDVQPTIDIAADLKRIGYAGEAGDDKGPPR